MIDIVIKKKSGMPDMENNEEGNEEEYGKKMPMKDEGFKTYMKFKKEFENWCKEKGIEVPEGKMCEKCGKPMSECECE